MPCGGLAGRFLRPPHACRSNTVHPVQVTQWKGVIRDHLPELFESPLAAGEDNQQLIAQLHEKIGQLSVEVDWLKKKCKQLGL